MSGGCSGGMEPGDERERKISDDVVTFLRKRSEHDAPRYAARVKTYLEMSRKRRRATEARRNSENDRTSAKRKGESEQKDKNMENTDFRGDDDDRLSKRHRTRSMSRTGSEPADACCRRRRRRRRRSCKCRRRRRRSCGRRRRRSRSRRRRRRSCRRRRRRRRGRCRRRCR